MLFCTFLYLHCTTTTWNDQNLSLLGTGNGKAINSTLSVRTGARSSLFSSSQNPLPLSNRTNWDNREKVWNDAKSVFQRRFHGRRRCRIVRSLFSILKNLLRADLNDVTCDTFRPQLTRGNILTVNPVNPHYESHLRSNMFFILVFVIFDDSL